MTLALHGPTLDAYVERRELLDYSEPTPNLIQMATVPLKANILPNPTGWAAVIALTAHSIRIFAIPGSLLEAQGTFTVHIAPEIARLSSTYRLTEHTTVNGHESELSPVMQQTISHLPGSHIKRYIALRRDSSLPVDVIVSDSDRSCGA